MYQRTTKKNWCLLSCLQTLLLILLLLLYISEYFPAAARSSSSSSGSSSIGRYYHHSKKQSAVCSNNPHTDTDTDTHNPHTVWIFSPQQFLLRKREIRSDSLALFQKEQQQQQQQASWGTWYRKDIPNSSGIMAGTSTTTVTTAHDVIWYVPNIIGYIRILLAVTSFVLMAVQPDQYLLATCLYLGSFVGDLFDGWAARKLDQCSIMGGLLDMITDRCATLGFLFILSGDYAPIDLDIGFPVYRLLFLSLMILDISSHWCQMYSSSLAKDGAHHKSEEGNQGRNVLVQWFYKYYWFFGYLCVGAEFTYICLYVTKHAPIHSLLYRGTMLLLYLCVPGCAAKQVVNLAQLTSACRVVAEHDAKEKNLSKNSSSSKNKQK